MLSENDAQPLISAALRGAGVEPADFGAMPDHILNAFVQAQFRAPPPDRRIAAAEIPKALGKIEKALRELEAAFLTIDAARRAVGPRAFDRAESLEHVQRAALGAIASSMIGPLQYAGIETQPLVDNLADAMPGYSGRLGFSRSWNGLFALAADRVKATAYAHPTKCFVAERDLEPWRDQLISDLARVYDLAAGKPAKGYGRCEGAKPGWHPPLSRFIRTLWPINDDNLKVPTNSLIRDALKRLPFEPWD